MAEVKLKGNAFNTAGKLPAEGDPLPDFELTSKELGDKKLSDYQGKRLVLNIFPSIDTDVCAASVRRFNELAASRDNLQVLCISEDLPFAQARFCGAEGIDNVDTLSTFRSDFGQKYGVELADGPMKGLTARAVIVADENGKVVHSQLVEEITEEPDYEAAMNAL